MSLSVRVALGGSNLETFFSIDPAETVENVRQKVIDQLLPDTEDTEKYGLYKEDGKRHLYLSHPESVIGTYKILDSGLLILKIKPTKVPVIMLRHIYIDTTEPISKYRTEMSKLLGLSSSEEIMFLQQSRPEEAKETDVAFGTKRGICLLANCDCDTYQKSEHGICMNCGHYPSFHKNLGKISEANEEEFRPLSNDTSFFDQGIVFTEGDSPLVIKHTSKIEKPKYLSNAPASTNNRKSSSSEVLSTSDIVRKVTRTRSNKENASLVQKPDERALAAASSFHNVLLSIKSGNQETDKTDSSPRLKKWAVRYRKSMDVRHDPLFSRPLEEVMDRPSETFAVPSFVVKIIEQLQKTALDHPGLFRLSGNQDKIDLLRLQIDLGRNVEYEQFDTDVLASTLKQYLQGLPEPILTNRLYPRFITVSKITDTELQLTYLSSLVNTLPHSHLDLLRYLVGFLQKVIEHEENNKMTIQNISIVFGPVLMQTNSDDPKTMMAHANLVTFITELLLTHSAKIFSSRAHSIHTVKALNPYFPKRGQEGALEVPEGAIIHVFKKENTMWYGEIDGAVGYFPRADITRSSKNIIITDSSDPPIKERSPSIVHLLQGKQSSSTFHFSSKKKEKKEKKEKKDKKKDKKAGDEVKTENPLFGLRKSATSRRSDVFTKTLPIGFDPNSLENYLPDDEYEEVFGVTKEEYFKLPLAKRNQLKDQIGFS